jgi:hypothetical protein
MSVRSAFGSCVLLCAMGMLAACSGGYPTDDEPLVLTHGMSRDAALEAMEIIGMSADRHAHWRYEPRAGCRLGIESRALDGGKKELDFLAQPLKATVIGEPDKNSHAVVAHLASEAPELGMRVLAGANWFDATQMKWLIEYFPVVCAN